MGRLDGKVAIITGAARGTGALTARLFAKEGARVVLADVLDEPGAAVARAIGANAHFIHLDVTTEPHWERAVEETALRFGRLDVLVNNAAVLHMSAIADTTPEAFLRVVQVNQLGTFLGIKSVIEPMKAAGGGSIVNVASVDGLRGQNGIVAYASSKWAVRGITRVAALELGRFGIRVNTVCPEAGSAEMVQPYMPPGVPGREGDPAHAADARRIRRTARSTSWCRTSRTRSCSSRRTRAARVPDPTSSARAATRRDVS